MNAYMLTQAALAFRVEGRVVDLGNLEGLRA